MQHSMFPTERLILLHHLSNISYSQRKQLASNYSRNNIAYFYVIYALHYAGPEKRWILYSTIDKELIDLGLHSLVAV